MNQRNRTGHDNTSNIDGGTTAPHRPGHQPEISAAALGPASAYPAIGRARCRKDPFNGAVSECFLSRRYGARRRVSCPSPTFGEYEGHMVTIRTSPATPECWN